MGKLLITRESNYIGCGASYNIFLDNQKVGKISNGRQIEIKINNGTHKLYLQNSLLNFGFKSNVLSFNSSNTSVINVSAKSVMSKMAGIQLSLDSNIKNESKENDYRYDALQKLHNLRNNNIIDELEYKKQKEKIMNGE